MQPDVTIVIPTYRRPRQLERQLRFLKQLENSYPVIVVDGTRDRPTKELNQQVARQYSFVRLRQYEEELHFGPRIADGAKAANTPYVLVSADDDFAFPSGIRACAAFLDSHADYSAAIGETFALSYNLARPLVRRGFAILDLLNTGTAPNQPKFIQRSMWYFAYTALGYIPLFYSLRRSDEVALSFGTVRPEMKHSSTELISNSLLLIRGKIAVLPIPFGLRDYSSEPIRDAMREGVNQHFPDEDIAYVRTVLTDALAEGEALSNEMAAHLIDAHLTQWKRDIPMRYTVSGQPTQMYRRYARLGQVALSIASVRRLAKMVGIDEQTMIALKAAQLEYIRRQI
jgi:glycosyltransferase domain-containing protein